MICEKCKREVECEVCAPLCICCYSGVKPNPKDCLGDCEPPDKGDIDGRD